MRCAAIKSEKVCVPEYLAKNIDDHSDPSVCRNCKHDNREQWRCNGGNCIDPGKKCDRIIDCEDGSDENLCESDKYLYILVCVILGAIIGFFVLIHCIASNFSPRKIKNQCLKLSELPKIMLGILIVYIIIVLIVIAIFGNKI